MSIVAQHLARELTAEQRRLLTIPEGRRVLTRLDFKLFCFTYFSTAGVMSSDDTGGQVSLSQFHADFIDDALRYVCAATDPGSSRSAWIAPRGAAKSTLLMMLIIWLAAHEHQRFVALFSATSDQSEDMLANIRGQFDSNQLLRQDFPDLCTPATRKMAAQKLSDNKTLIIQSNGFICTGRGITTSVLGLRIDGTRPTMLVLDDIERGESNAAGKEASKLLVTVQDDIFPLSLNAHVIWVGTTTRPGGLTEQLVHAALGMEHASWVEQENFRVNYRPALVTADDGTKYSMWPQRWSTEFLLEQQGTRSFRKNFMCLPAPDDYAYWATTDFRYATLAAATRVVLSIDPAVTTKKSSDRTALAVIAYSPSEQQCEVRTAVGVRLRGKELRDRVLTLLAQHPDIGRIVIETNQGGDMWLEVLHDLPVPVRTIHQSEKKEVRAARLLNRYQLKQVVHTESLPDLEQEMVEFPNGAHDDLVDSCSTGVEYLMKAQPKSTRRVHSYA